MTQKPIVPDSGSLNPPPQPSLSEGLAPLLSNITLVIQQSRQQVQQAVNSAMVQCYWRITPKIHFRFFEFKASNDKSVVILEIQAASHTLVQFDGVEFIRVGSYKQKLREFPEKERALWRAFDRVPFER